MSLLSLKESLNHIPHQFQSSKYARLELIIRHWETIVGAYLAPKSQPTGVYQEVLQVATAGSAWCQELSAQRSIILDRVNQILRSAGIQHPYRGVHFSTSRWRSRDPVALPSAPLTRNPTLTLPKPETPISACHRFRQAIHTNHNLIICPRCRSQALKSDVDRWGVCRFCARERLIKS